MDEGIEKFASSGKDFSLKTAFLFLNLQRKIPE